MLKEIKINNIILIDSTNVLFKQKFNVISGETGSGKSALIYALRLLLGDRADSSIIRKGEKKGVIQAIFSIENYPLIESLLENSGIEHLSENDLIIRREITQSGKNRIFINNQSAHLLILQKIGEHLAQFVGQHASRQLNSLDFHQEVIDLFGEHQELLHHHAVAWRKKITLEKKLKELKNNESKNLRELEVCQNEGQEIENTNLIEGEEDELFQEFSLLHDNQEIANKLNQALDILCDNSPSILMQCNQLLPILDDLNETSKSLNFKDLLEISKKTLLEFEEISYQLRTILGSCESQPHRLSTVNSRLTLINQIKKKYGSNFEEVMSYYEKVKEKQNFLENIDHHFEALEDELKKTDEKCHTLANQLTEKRKETIQQLSELLTQELQDLNMAKAQVKIELSPIKHSINGKEQVEIFLAPNVGENKVSLRECASGGEISRLTLAIKVILSGKKNIPTFIFDEIDANIGGETALIIGKKLKKLALHHQIICITHFPQVAKQAEHHLQVTKIEKNQRTFTEITVLNKESRPKEISRMLGN